MKLKNAQIAKQNFLLRSSLYKLKTLKKKILEILSDCTISSSNDFLIQLAHNFSMPKKENIKISKAYDLLTLLAGSIAKLYCTIFPIMNLTFRAT